MRGKEHMGRTRRKWENILKADLKEIGYECVNWIKLDLQTRQ
jgi:hypothetical protein